MCVCGVCVQSHARHAHTSMSEVVGTVLVLFVIELYFPPSNLLNESYVYKLLHLISLTPLKTAFHPIRHVRHGLWLSSTHLVMHAKLFLHDHFRL